MYRSFDEISAKAKELGPLKMAILFPDEPDVMRSVRDGMKRGLVEPILVGDRGRIEAVAEEVGLPLKDTEVRHETDAQKGANLCLDLVTGGPASFVMKGNVLTSYLYKALIRATKRLAPEQTPCTLCFHQVDVLDKIFILTDPGVNIRPDLAAKQKMLANALSVIRGLGCERPKAMVMTADRPDGSLSPAASHAEALREAALKGDLGECEITVARNLARAFPDHVLNSETFPDVIIAHNIEAGNVLVKCVDHMGLGIRQCATIGAGIVLLTPSRSDGYESRMLNIALGVVLADSGGGF